MKEITVISGKGGTGKTTVAANLAALAGDLVLADCDVDAPNMHLLMQPNILEEETFKGGKLAIKDVDKCIECGLCKKLCEFEAITSDLNVDAIKCEGCGLCVAKCPTSALKLKSEVTGQIYKSQSNFGPMIHAKLKIGAENSGKLVSEVKNRAEDISKLEEKNLILIDGSPGIGCPVIASLNGVDAVLIVTEPTKSGLSDLKRVLEVVKHFNIPGMVVINKYNLNQRLTTKVEEFCVENEVLLVGKIPFESLIVEAMRQAELIIDYDPNSKSTLALKNIWEEVKKQIEE
jgi:MinD superfamily P-loop ATPase